MTEYILSIDWDFFIWNGMDANNALESKFASLFDWGNSELHAPTLQSILWALRKEAFANAGFDMETIATIRPELGCTLPHKFLEVLLSKFDLSSSSIWMGDSHLWGFDTVVEAFHSPEPKKLILFDAHCDLGYSQQKIQKQIENQEYDCGSWLYHALRFNLVEEALVVYPDWKNWANDWSFHTDFIQDFNVTATTWSEFVNRDIKGNVNYINVARSSTWTPPYLDREFLQFVKSIPSEEIICLDCDNHSPGNDACTPRLLIRKILEGEE